ncbi:MAG: (2Fe-2S)-binding protein [Alphaproteobacteria bacterium]|nr:(2Fe-2S)-binding protein [Alphaproteobacteria bacterium]
MPSKKVVTLHVNGEAREITVPAHRTLLEVLRELGHVEVKCGCEKGDCGACAVLLDGEAVDSCLTLAWRADGRAVTTVTGLGGPDDVHPLQAAFIEHGGAQCGYCTPGMIMAAKALLDEDPSPTTEDIKRGLSGNLCRCTGYTRIFSAIHSAARTLREQRDVV